MPVVAPRQIEEFVAGLRTFVAQEHEASRADVAKRWSGSVSERVDKGNAIADISVLEAESLTGERGTRVLLQCSANDSRYREGDCVKLTPNAPEDASATLATGRISAIKDDQVELICDRSKVEAGQTGLTLDASTIDLRDFYEHAITAVSSTSSGRERIIPLLLGLIEPAGASFDELAHVDDLRPGLNEKQAEAVVQSAATDLCYLVQGPPGTGKTQVLAALVRRLLEKKPDAAILITSFTHRAIDNAVARVVKAKIAEGRVYKVGAIKPTEPIPHELNVHDIPCAKDGGPLIIGATPFALKNRVKNIEFDWVIVDEASQMTLPLAVMAMIAGRRWIFFGDEKQMPPVVLSISPAEAVEQSVFGVLKRGGYNTRLAITYRLPPPLAEWPSHEFYDDDLVSAPSISSQRLHLAVTPSGFGSILAPDPAAVFIPLPHSDSTTASPLEIAAVVRVVRALNSVGYPLSKIGVVVPYRRQARLLRKQLDRAHLQNADLKDLIADTVERMQGQEREIVIVSLTTSSIKFATDVADFLFQPQRLNVAITRPQMKLIVIGSTEWLERFPSEIPQAALFARFLAFCARGTIPN